MPYDFGLHFEIELISCLFHPLNTFPTSRGFVLILSRRHIFEDFSHMLFDFSVFLGFFLKGEAGLKVRESAGNVIFEF